MQKHRETIGRERKRCRKKIGRRRKLQRKSRDLRVKEKKKETAVQKIEQKLNQGGGGAVDLKGGGNHKEKSVTW